MSKELRMFYYLISLSLLAVFSAALLGSFFSVLPGNVALIKIDGEIGQPGIFGGVSADDLISLIDEAERNPNVKVLVFSINSPGGSIVSVQEVVERVKEVQKPKVAWIRDMGTSGAYWIASACDAIVASPFSITGSIGVVASYLEFSGLFERYGIKYVNLSIPKKKDMLTPYRELTEEEREDVMEILNESYWGFLEDVAHNRNMSVEEVMNLSDEGAVMLGKEAYERGFVDYLGGKKKALEVAKELGNLSEVEVSVYEKKRSMSELLSDLLFGLSRFELKASQTPS
ncbi:MAG TPA: signal peptide peptidase SppA [Candidatus Aenigmarchaeota archaeon]|nr:signal peptide peptidase SppA [Candidatus Aenigmarchaeota archaeon]